MAGSKCADYKALVRVVDNGNGVVVDRAMPFTIASADPVISPSGDNFYPDDNTSIKSLAHLMVQCKVRVLS